MAAQPFHGVAVADVKGHPVERDVLHAERFDHRADVGVGEHVEVVLVEQDVACMARQNRRWTVRFDDQGVQQGGFRYAQLPGTAAQAVRREGAREVRVGGQLLVVGQVVVGAGDDADAAGMGVVGEPGEVWRDGLRPGDVQLALRPHEIHLRVHIPEHGGHFTVSRSGMKRSARPTLAMALPSQRTMSAVKSCCPALANSVEPTP